MNGVVAVDNSTDHAVAIKQDGTVWAWGRNDGGKIGNGTSSPLEVPNATQVVGLNVN
ncbi:hypothetical protein [Paenibacillus qinlingensis]|uniref:hypothetical protein n=1 Tax=Paenibacillus qinlingensis TaxID=1837343 RepID=UPI0037C76181